MRTPHKSAAAATGAAAAEKQQQKQGAGSSDNKQQHLQGATPPGKPSPAAGAMAAQPLLFATPLVMPLPMALARKMKARSSRAATEVRPFTMTSILKGLLSTTADDDWAYRMGDHRSRKVSL